MGGMNLADEFHAKFSTEEDALRIAEAYNDKEMRQLLPRGELFEWLAYHHFFAVRAKKEWEREELSDSWALNRLLAVAFSSDLHSKELADDPFVAWPEDQLLNGVEEPLSPASLRQHELRALAEVLNETHDSFMRGRLADILWTYWKKWTNYGEARRYAEWALEEYIRTPASIDLWCAQGAKGKWWRAAKIAQMLEPGGKQANIVSDKLLEPIRNQEPRAEELASEIADLLMASKLPVAIPAVYLLDQALQRGLAYEMAENGDGWVIGFHESLGKWRQFKKIKGELDEVHRTVGDYFAEKAEEFFRKAPKPHNLQGLEWAKNARNAYAKMTKRAKEESGVPERVKNLRFLQEKFLKKAEKNFKWREILVPRTGLKQKMFDDAINGKTAPEAVFIFLFGLGEPDLDEIRRRARKSVSTSFFRQTTMTYFQKDGRIFGKVPPVPRTESGPDEFQIDESDEIAEYCREVIIRGEKILLPAFECLKNRIALTVENFEDMCRDSSWVAENHSKVTAKGLFYGWQGDFWTAVSLLSPQVEASVRMRMKKDCQLTTHLQSSEFEQESGLSSLLSKQDITHAIPDELERFELRALFSDGNIGGFNYRNDLGHGLLTDEATECIGLMYAWWFVWRQVLKWAQRS